ncbi:hypothetical protein N665_0166s0069 [Sinapis alba]|nr:hypothetical protein N665_0166s0069 [Sinapis alba]
MTDRFGYGSFAGVPQHSYWLYPHPPASTPPFLATHPVESYDPMIPHGSYHQTPSYGNSVHGGEDSSKDTVSPGGGYYETSSGVFFCPPMERQQHVPYSSATVSSLADMLIRNSQEPFYVPIPPSGICANYYSGYGTHGSVSPAAAVSAPPVEPYVRVPSVPESSSKTEAFLDGNQTGIRFGDGRSFGDNVNSSHLPVYVQSSLHGASVEPVLGYGEASGHVKPLSENPDLRDGTVGSTGSKSPLSSHPLQFDAKSSSLYQRTDTLVSDSRNGVSGSSFKNAIGDLNCDDEHGSWNQFIVPSEGPTMFSMGSESCGAVKADNRNAAQSDVSYETHSETHSEGIANQPSEDVQAKTCKLQEQFDKKSTLLTDLGIKGHCRSNADCVSTAQSPVRDQGDFTPPASSPKVSSVVNALHDLSEVLVYECFNNKSLLKPEQLENLDKIVGNLTKCLRKITCNKTIAGDASDPTQAMHVSCPNVVDLNEIPNVAAKDFQGFNVKPLDSFGFKEPVDMDKDEMTQRIKNILASNFPDGEEIHSQTLLYKNLWLETEAALCSTTCVSRYHRIKNETSNLESQNREISADASTFMHEPFLNHQKSVSIINKVEQETSEPLIKHGSTCGNNVVIMSHDAPQSSRFNSAPVGAVLSLMSTGCLGPENHGNFKPDVQILDTIKQESPASTTEENYNDVIDRFQIVKQQETNSKLKSQNCSETRLDEQEDNPEASEMATIGRSSHMSDVMGRFQIVKRREAEQVQKSLNSLDSDSYSDSDFDSDSDNDQTRNRTQMYDYLWSGSIGGNSQIEMCAGTEPSADGKGYESPTSDWEHVLKDD